MKSPFLDEELLSAEARLDFDPSLERLAKESPFLEASLEFVEEEVLGKDERTLVADTLKVPNRWICAIDILIDNPDWPKSGPKLISKSRATGVLVGPRYVLTAAHVSSKLTIEVDGKEQLVDVKGFLVSPARNGDNSKNPFGAVKSKAIRVSPPYRVLRKKIIQSKTVEVPITQIDDYALIILEKDLDSSTHSRMNGVLGYWGHDQTQAVVQRMEPSAIEGKKIVVVGYPGDRCGKDVITGSASQKKNRIGYCRRTRTDEWASTQWKDVGTLQVEENSTTVFHTADTYEGQSGAPICLSVDGKLVLIGVHTKPSDAHKNKGVRVTRKTLRELCGWMNDDAGYEIGTIKDDTLIVQPQVKPTKETLELDALETAEEIEGEEWLEADEEGSDEFDEELDEEDFSTAEDESPAYEVEDDRLFEAFAPKVSQADLRKRIDEYFDLANAEYTIPAHTLPDGTKVKESKVRARPQFRYARGDSEADKKVAISTLRRTVGRSLAAKHVMAIGKAIYGRPKPSNIAAITQALIDKGELNAVRTANPGLSDDQLVRALQRKFKVGIDCAGYVQLAFIFAFTGSDNDTPKLRKSLGLNVSRGEERLRGLPAANFAKVKEVDAKTGDLFVLEAPATSTDGAWHTVIIVDHTVSGDVHTFEVDASWGTDLYGEEAGGVGRRKLEFNVKSKKWWDISPIDGTVCGVAVKKGDKACENDIGPYDGHPPHGIYRAKHKK